MIQVCTNASSRVYHCICRLDVDLYETGFGKDTEDLFGGGCNGLSGDLGKNIYIFLFIVHVPDI